MANIGLHKGKENNYLEKPKCSTIYTPEALAKYIYWDIIIERCGFNFPVVLDIGCGEWSLSTRACHPDTDMIVGVDIVEPKNLNPSRRPASTFIQADYLNLDICSDEYFSVVKPNLILCNPPFNHEKKPDGKRNLLPYEFLKKIMNDFPDVPTVLFCPFGMLFNVRRKSERLEWLNENREKLSSVLFLPLDIYANVKYWSCVTFWNFPKGKLEPFYFYIDNVRNRK